jgi:hypothetical protein
MNLSIGSGVDSVAPTMTMVDGTTYTGYGRANIAFPNSSMFVAGVPSQDTAPDNNSLTGTNVVTIIGNRRSGVSSRRNPIVIGDTLGGINFNGQSASNSTGIGVNGASITATALDNFTGGTARGTQFTISTVNTATTTSRNRLLLTDRLMQLSADQYQFNNGGYSNIPLSFTTSTWNSSIDQQTFGNTAGTVSMLQLNNTDNTYRNTTHQFSDRTGSFSALNLTTSSATFGSTVTITGYKKCFGDFSNSNTTTFTINTGTALALTAGTASNCSIQAGSQILISQSGTYNLQFSIQLDNSDNADHNFWCWLRKNGSDVSSSATKYTVVKTGANVAALTFNITSNGSDYYQIMAAVDDTTVTVPSYAANSQGFPHPAVPGVIANLIPVGA